MPIVKLAGGDRRFKNWFKVLTGVDRSKQDGYAFLGEFVKGELLEVDVGTLVMHYHEEGSAKYHYPSVEVLRVERDGSLTEVFSGESLDSPWALGIRDVVADLFDEPQSNGSLHTILFVIEDENSGQHMICSTQVESDGPPEDVKDHLPPGVKAHEVTEAFVFAGPILRHDDFEDDEDDEDDA
jgi:hypothetical protein